MASEEPGFAWPVPDERSAAAMCYTSGTTGAPKGVVYSHRSTFLHTFGSNLPSALPVSERDRVLVIVPMFHANAWGLAYSAWMTGADLVLPERFVQAEPLCLLIEAERPTVSAGVPTIWNDVLNHGRSHPDVDLSSLRLVTAGGSAPPRALMEGFEQRFGVRMIQGWGMTETSPLCTLSHPPRPLRRERPGLADEGRAGHPRCRAAHRRTGRHGPAERRADAGRDRGPRPLDHRLVLPRRRAREVR